MQSEEQRLSQPAADMPLTPAPTEPSSPTMGKRKASIIPLDLPISPPETDAGSDASSVAGSDAAQFPLPPPSRELQVLDVDKNTPDSHVPRDSRLIRLTGVHPFNVEPPLSALFDEGFLTSQDLFYVRNHGAVPEVHDEDIPDWELSVEGYMMQASCRVQLCANPV